MQAKYARDPEFALRMRYPAALAFLPPEKVVDSFEVLRNILCVKKRPAAGSDEWKVREVMNYMERTWVGKHSDAPLFALNLWNMTALTLDKIPRTNNAVEGWHNAISQFVGCHRPSIWTFIRKIKQEQDLQEVKMAKIIAYNVEPQGLRYVAHDKALY